MGTVSDDAVPATSLPPAEDGPALAEWMTVMSDAVVTWDGWEYTANLGGGQLGPYGLESMKAFLGLGGMTP